MQHCIPHIHTSTTCSFSHLLLLQTRNTNTLLQDINDWEKQSLKTHPGIPLAVKWLRLCASNSGDLSLIPGRGTKIPHAVGCGQKIKKKFFNEKKKTHPIIGDSLYYSVYICICFKFFSIIFSKTTENHSNDIRKQIISLDLESEGKERRDCVHGVECVDIVSWGKLFTSLEPSNPKPKAQIHFLLVLPPFRVVVAKEENSEST